MPKGHSKQKKSIGVLIFIAILMLAIILLSKSCNRCYNTVNDSHFNCDGTLIVDSTDISFQPTTPAKIKFFVEVSGSMNGFFRANKPTQFKTDLWQIISYYAPIADNVTILTNDGNVGRVISLNDFQTLMNTGAFVSNASTKVPIMLQTIANSIDIQAGEVAVLISDMIYSPVGSPAPEALLDQYSTDISNVLGSFDCAVSLIAATSNFLDKNGKIVYNSSPYYYLIMGAPNTVAALRNGFSTLLENNGNFVDNIETGFHYGTRPSYSFEIPENCYQLETEPTFVGYEPDLNDTCVIKLKVNLENYRWIIADVNIFKNAFKCKSLYGSEVHVGNVTINTQNIVKAELDRTAIATVELKLCHMPQDADVIEWTLELPDLDIMKYTPFLGATSEDDRSKTYSLESFLKGMFYGGVVNDSLKPNYILVSKKS